MAEGLGARQIHVHGFYSGIEVMSICSGDTTAISNRKKAIKPRTTKLAD
jgi:hypothetical protein